MSQLALAEKLNISQRAASFLTQEAGYYRHTLKDPDKPVSLEAFRNMPYVKYFIKKMRLKKHEEES